jgi:hypothetical protein
MLANRVDALAALLRAVHDDVGDDLPVLVARTETAYRSIPNLLAGLTDRRSRWPSLRLCDVVIACKVPEVGDAHRQDRGEGGTDRRHHPVLGTGGPEDQSWPSAIHVVAMNGPIPLNPASNKIA